MRFFAAIVILAGIAMAMSPACALVYVKFDSPGPAFDGNSWDTAYHSIQQGIDDATGGEEVWVARGVYVEQAVLKSGVALKGGYSGVGDSRDTRANPSIIDGSWAGGGYAVTGANVATIDGFTIVGGDYVVCCSSTSPTISNNLIRGGVICGVYCFSSSAAIVNNVVVGNDAGIICDISSPTITNNTIVGNDDIGISLSGLSHPTISNNIVAFNSTGIYKKVATGDTVPTLSRNDVYGNGTANYNGVSTGAGDIALDPQFMGISMGDLHIQSGSPCRNAGNNIAPGLPSLDIDGQARVQGGTVDIGADESYGETTPAPARIVYVNVSASPGGDGASWEAAFDTIQAAVDDAFAHGGGEVWVARGIYNEQVSMRPFVSLYGGFAGTESTRASRIPSVNTTVICASQTTVPAVWGANLATIDGFTIRGGYHGISCYYTSPTISNNVIAGNGRTGVHCLSGAAVVTNNTIVGNDAGIACDSGNQKIYNNIVAFNRIGISGNGTTATLSHNDVYGSSWSNYTGLASGVGDIPSDPQFAGYSQGNLHIQSGSPCRNAGDSAAPGLPAFDADGQARVQGSAVDIGADESYGETYSIPVRVLRVNSTAAPGGDGSSWPLAYTTIASAVDDAALNGGAEIWVAAGTYAEQVAMRPFAQLYGGFAGTESSRASRNPNVNVTTIDGSGLDMSATVVKASSISTLDGFTVTGGFVGVGSDFGSPSVSNNTISGNSAYGVVCGSSASVVGSRILGNGNGVACVAGRPTVSLNVISGNSAYGVITGSTSVISGNIVSGNAVGVGCDYESPILTNNTIVGNSTFGIVYDYASSPVISNNISAWNAYGIYNDKGTYPSPGNTWGIPFLVANDFYSNSIGNYSQVTPGADISADPLFVNRLAGDFHIPSNSPCKNVGSNVALGMAAVDIDGLPRLSGGVVDIGADEVDGEPNPPDPPADPRASRFNSGVDGWNISLWRSGTYALGTMAWNAGGCMRSNGSGNTDNNDPCTREGGEIWKVISTVGLHAIQVSYDLRVNSLGASNSGSGTPGCVLDHNLCDEQLTIYYSTNGGTNWTESQYILRSTLLSYLSFGTRTLNLSAISGCNNNPNFALRFRWQLNTTSDTADLDNIVVSGISDDTTPPAAITGFTAESGSGQITLRWRNPTDSDFTGTMIRYKTTGYPTSVTDGILVCNRAAAPNSTDTSTHTELANGTRYYYSAFAHDGVPNYSTAANTATTPAIEATIQGAKGLADGQIRSIKGKVVSSPFAGFFYIHEPAGLGIGWGIKAISSVSVSLGDLVDVVGTMGGAGLERYIDCTGNCVIVTPPGPP